MIKGEQSSKVWIFILEDLLERFWRMSFALYRFLVDCEAEVDARNLFELLSLTSLLFFEIH